MNRTQQTPAVTLRRAPRKGRRLSTRRIVSQLSLLLALAILAQPLGLRVAASNVTEMRKKVNPILECIIDNGNGMVTAWFGYRNPNAMEVSLPIGAGNKFTPTPQFREQPTTFLPGRHKDIFAVTFSSGDLTWTLDGKTEVASPSFPTQCRPVALKIQSPNNGSSTGQSSVTVRGTASDEGPKRQHGLRVYVNESEAVYDASTGAWEKAGVPLNVGDNVIVARAVDGDGNQASAQITVTREDREPKLSSAEPPGATQGQSLQVTLHGRHTHWAAGQTLASFGGEISVGGAPAGEFGPVTVVDEKTLTASLVISPTAALGPRNVRVKTPNGAEVELVNKRVFTVSAEAPPGNASSIVRTLAGTSDSPGFADGEASQAKFRHPAGVAAGADDVVYVADAGNNRIRVVRPGTQDPPVMTVSTIAGDGEAGFADGAGAQARFNNPQGVAVDSNGVVYVADTDNHRVRRVAPDGAVSTIAGDGTAGFTNGAGAQARFNSPRGVTVDGSGIVYVADTGNSAVRRISQSGEVSTIAGDGTAGSNDSPDARFDGLSGITIDGGQIYVYLADRRNHRIRRLDSANIVITIAGAERGFADGSAGEARFARPLGIAVDGSGRLVIADAFNSLIRLVDPALAASGSPQAVTTLAGTGGRGAADGAGNVASFTLPRGVAVSPSSAVLVADTGNHTLRRILLPPAILSLTPGRARVGESVTISGERFDARAPDRNVVRFTRSAQAGGGQVSAQVTFASRNSLTVVVPEGAASGPVAVEVEGGTTVSPEDFEVITPPQISGISPASGRSGTIVTITGRTLKAAVGETSVAFTGEGGTQVEAVVSLVTDTEVRAVVPSAAVTGPVYVRNAEGTAVSPASFEVIPPPPSIDNFSPKRGPVGALVSLTGTALRLGSAEPSVTFAGPNSTRLPALITLATPTEVRALVPDGAVSGPVSLSTSAGTAETAEPFVVELSQDFEVTAAPSSATAVQRGTATFLVHVNSAQQSPFTGRALLSAQGLPASVVAKFAPPKLVAGSISTLSVILADVDLAPGSYPFTIVGTSEVDGSEVSRNASATLNVVPGGRTTLTGRVMSTEGDSIMGATASLDGRSAPTDSAGTFILYDVTEGANRPLMVDGRTASAPNRTYPVILEPATIVANEANVVPYIFYLPPIDVQYEAEVIPGQTTIAVNPRLPGLEMVVPADANLRNRDGSPVTRVSITPLPIDRTPAPLPPFAGTSLVYTAQPGGAVADVAMPVVYPNLGGADPGTRVELYAFDHDVVNWYVYGYGRVSDDGRTISPEINPDTGRSYGLKDFSWSFPQGPLPNGDPGGGGGGGSGGGGGKGPGKGGGKGDDCPESSQGANPVDYTSGIKFDTATDIASGQARGGIDLVRRYTSTLGQFCARCPFGRGWTHNYYVSLTGSFTQGGAGRVVMPDERNGRLFSYTRTDSDGSLVFRTTATISQLGDELRRLTNGTYEYRYSDGLIMRFDSEGRLTSAVDRNGETTALTYEGGLLTRITDSSNRSVTLEYENEQITRAKNPNGQAWNYAYDGNARLETVTDPLGHVTTYAYDFSGRLTSVVNAFGEEEKRITYNFDGRVIEQKILGVGTERYEYELSGGVVTSTTITKPSGEKVTKRFNAAGYVVGHTDEAGQEIRYGRDLITNLATTTSGPCACSQGSRQYDARGNLLSLIDPSGKSEHYEYDSVYGNITSMTDKSGRAAILTYDARGNNTSLTNESGETIHNTYDARGQLTSATDARGRITRYEYDGAGNQTAVVDIASNRTTFEYDARGRMTAKVDELGRRATITYDDLDRVTSETNELGLKTTHTYDERGNRLTSTDEMNNVWRMGYDEKNRLVSRTNPLGRTTLTRYDAKGRITSTVSPAGRTTRYSYDQAGQLAKMTDPSGGALTYNYDKEGNLLSLKDQRGHTTTFTYDESFRIVTRRDPLGLVSSTTYDQATGNVTEKADRLGRRISYSYDAQNRVTAINYPDAIVNYTYDAVGRLTRIDDSQSGSIVRTYDDLDRLTSETTPAGAVAYTYNAAGQRTSLKADDRPPVVYGYDAAGRIKTITQGTDVFTFAYDELSHLKTLQRPNGVTTSYAYNEMRQLARITHADASARVLEEFSYGYDLDGRAHSINSPFGGTLPASEATASEADAANRVGRHGAADFTFNREGELTSEASEQGAVAYTWDARGRLTRVTLPGGQTVSYTYDATGRRLNQTAGDVTTSFLYDGKDVVLDKRSDGSSVEYLNGMNLDQKLRQTDAATGPVYFLADHIGSTAALADSGGNVVERLRYEVFGASAGSALTRYGFTGRERDAHTGLLYYRARWYDPRRGRFLSEDTAGFEGGTNLYEYAANNPVSLSDPLGMWPTQRPITGTRPFGGHVHQNAIQRTIGPLLPADEVEELKRMQDVIDKTDNDLEDAHKHAMTQTGFTHMLAYTMANDWIKQHMIAARCYARNNQRMEAMRELGLAIHTLQDNTSPAHHFFKVWENGGEQAWMGPYFQEVYGTDKGAYATDEYLNHMLTENFDPGPNSQLDWATYKAYLWFRGLPLPYDYLQGFRADPKRWIRLGASDAQ